MAWVRPCPLVSPQTAGPSGSAGGAPTRRPRRVARLTPCRKRVLTGREGKPRTQPRSNEGRMEPSGDGVGVQSAGCRRKARRPGPETRGGPSSVWRGCAGASETDARPRSARFMGAGGKSAQARGSRSEEAERPGRLPGRWGRRIPGRIVDGRGGDAVVARK